ncbi:mannose-1-phosphate guanylyltransferase/mannose-6-phosphate isomerase [Polynucleobacter sp. AM-7D1]|uniref:mannose-1-phosphate guanylyltransferase/mannose-6-phosphate isomerase n=1 Tax=Polynucleobacter sp. AM-7D1 TaxID=2689102 RepID=UPI001BFDF492|nr:mannose-1-phosphate guanylyltransferase/mannose-6-phosphate isomerase [Polynucleobacter sp. AM-7D1]QWE29647.1 mannose-1-phosphate guanylyltransferase/mannose-6-phosphate isomerase [Polynucleobacter sp. AM-7D1]
MASDNLNIQVVPVILCGGSGTRLWPLSRRAFPKQFLVIAEDESNHSLFQQTIQRMETIYQGDRTCDGTVLGSSVIIANEDHRFLVLDQLRELKNEDATLLLEPVGRNTAPALTLAALQLLRVEEMTNGNDNDPILVITPADQVIQSQTDFAQALQGCIATVIADKSKQTLAILGVKPTSPETGYGYIKRSRSIGVYQEYIVEGFVEKPDEKTAKEYLSDSYYLWNSGIFVMHASTWLAAAKEFCPNMLSATEAAWIARAADKLGDFTFIRPNKEIFKDVPSESIDYAVIEKCPGSKYQIKMIELDAGWNDLGSWDAAWNVGPQDEGGNVVIGDIITMNSKNSLIHSSSRLVCTVGINNLIIVETADAVLVADKKNSQDVKSIVAELEGQKREEKNLHRKVIRPWGWYDCIDEGEHFKVKRIQIGPGENLSLQMHQHRAEHWVVIKGVAEITNGNHVLTLSENQSTYIPRGQIHRIANLGKDILEIIEVQSGNYFGEDDIIRFEDSYGRS